MQSLPPHTMAPSSPLHFICVQKVHKLKASQPIFFHLQMVGALAFSIPPQP